MSYRSLLFCPDDKTARLVTQVLTELDFAVQAAGEPFSAVKRIADEHFDALVVDCQNEQDAALLFKAARNSAQNHSALSVAVVEGQAGVAKAFRIGANLVLTKPINIEQSKGTLRVARGLLKKNETKSAGSISSPTQSSHEIPIIASKPLFPPGPVPVPSPVASTTTSPFSGLELDAEPTPIPEASEAALLESLPQLKGNPASESQTQVFRTQAEPIAIGSAGQAAAPAFALEKPKVIESKSGVMSPLVTNEPIVVDKTSNDAQPAPIAPAFSSYSGVKEGQGGGKFLKVAIILALLGAAGYFGWQKFHLSQFLQSSTSQANVSSQVSAPASNAASEAPASSSPTQPVANSQPTFPEDVPVPKLEPEKIASAPVRATQSRDSDDENIEIKEMPMSGEIKPTPAKPSPAPLVVKADSTPKITVKPVQSAPAPPTVSSVATASNAALPNLGTSSATLPHVAPESLRVSQGVSQGLVLKKVAPEFPSSALQLHRDGTVEMLATISKDGAITKIRVLNGDPLFVKSATDAVRQWKYRPYLLNGEPVEIETQITINFKAPH